MDNPTTNQPSASTTPTMPSTETAGNVVTPPDTPAQPAVEQVPGGLGAPTPTPSFEAPSDKKPLKIIGLLLLAIVVIGGMAVGGYYLGVNKILFPGSATPTPEPTVEPTPTATTDPTADWKTYTNMKYTFSIKYPPTLVVSDKSESGTLGERIFFSISKTNPLECKGDCPIIENSVKVSVANLDATKIEGYEGEIGGCVARRYISYVFHINEIFITFTLYATSCNNDGESVSGIVGFDESDKDIDIFNQILSTFQYFLEEGASSPKDQ